MKIQTKVAIAGTALATLSTLLYGGSGSFDAKAHVRQSGERHGAQQFWVAYFGGGDCYAAWTKDHTYSKDQNTDHCVTGDIIQTVETLEGDAVVTSTPVVVVVIVDNGGGKPVIVPNQDDEVPVVVVTPDPEPTPSPIDNPKHPHCDNGNGNGGEGCNASTHGNNDETSIKGDKVDGSEHGNKHNDK